MVVDLGMSCFTGSFDLYCLFVQLIAGNLLWAMLLVIGILFAIGILTKMNILTIIIINLLFISFYMTMYWGGIYTFFMLIASLLWFIASMYRYFRDIT